MQLPNCVCTSLTCACAFLPWHVHTAAEGAGAAVVPAGYLLGANTMRTSTASLGSGVRRLPAQAS